MRPTRRLSRHAVCAAVALFARLAGCREKHEPLKPTVDNVSVPVSVPIRAAG